MSLETSLKRPFNIILATGGACLVGLIYWATLNWTDWMIYITSQQKELHGKLSQHMANVSI
ncbi:hypothetical protein A3744_22990 [Oleiphilus sp. HI0073]|nr:hypothetical protein A3744_22990 [Oleiphilus sp. HI0073]